MSDTTTKGLQLRSKISKDGELELTLAEVTTPEPGPDEVVLRIEGSPQRPPRFLLCPIRTPPHSASLHPAAKHFA